MQTNSMQQRYMPAVLLCMLLIGLADAAPAVAQVEASTGQIVGTVLDQQRAAIPGAEIKIVNPAIGFERVTVTNQAGLYRAPLLPAGVYSVSASMTGFQTEVRTNVQVNVGTSVDVNFVLKVGNITETIEVNASAGVETTRSETGAIVSSTAIRDLPINGRRFHDFITLTPTVQVEPQRGQISFAGQRGINGNISIDGADYNEPFFGGIRGGERANSAFTIPQEAVGEFQVVKAGYNAEFGRSTAGLVNVITKSGTNEIHGSAFYLLRHKELASSELLTQFFQSGISQPTQNQFGGSFGGPIARDRMFFFTSYERQDYKRPRAVNYARLTGYTPKTEGLEAYNYYKQQEGEFTQTNDANAFLARVDTQFNSAHRLNVRYNFSTNDALNAVATGEAISPFTTRALSTNGTEMDRTQVVAGQFTSIFSPTFINDARFQYSWEERPREPNANQANVSTYVGEFGSRNFLPTTLTDWRLQAADALSWVKGRHTLKFGFEFNHVWVNQTFGFNQQGAFSVSGSSVDAALATISASPNRFDSTAVTYRLQLGNLLMETTRDEIALFAQDTWRVTNNLTLNFGLRYEAIYNPEADVSNSLLYNRVKGIPLGLGSVDPAIIPDNTNQWAPRFGFAWDPFGNSKSVIRGHAGMYYAATPLLLYAGPVNNFRQPPGDLSVQLPLKTLSGDTRTTVYKQLLAGGINLNGYTLDKLPMLTPSDITKIATALGLSPDPYLGSAPMTITDNYNNPRSTQLGLGMEQELYSDWKIGAEFTYVNTVNLQRNKDLNIPLPGTKVLTTNPDGTVATVDQSGRPFYGLRGGKVTYDGKTAVTTSRPQRDLASIQIRDSSARSLYRGLTFRAEYTKRRYGFKAYYTLGWNYSDDDNERSSGGLTYENGFNLKPEYGYNDLDQRHQFQLHSRFELPLGFELAQIMRLYSARPFDARTGADSNEDQGGSDRPYLAKSTPYLRNAFRNQPLHQFDLRLLKSFSLWNDEARLQFSFEFFNIFNFDNVQIGSSNFVYGLGIDTAGNPVAPGASFRRLRLDSGMYDPVNVPGDPFQMQIGLRLLF